MPPAKKTINVSRKPARVPQVLLFKVTMGFIPPGQSQRPWRTIATDVTEEIRELGHAIIEAFDFEPDKQFGFYDNLYNYILSDISYTTFLDMDFEDDDDEDEDDLDPAARARLEAFVADHVGEDGDENAPADPDLIEVATAASNINPEEVYAEVQAVTSQLFFERMLARLQAALPERLHAVAVGMLGSMKDAAELEAAAGDDDDFDLDDDDDDDLDNDYGLDLPAAQVFTQTGNKMLFIYDHGSPWRFEVELIGNQARQPGMNYPLIIEEKGESPSQYAPFGV
jgi:hypothetical protein